ncbi:MAG TPA: (Fe-S)-binding protein [Bacteroidales bacterium]|nr:(Fe-S)-binding protein [Bacteroidales bacterium]
METSTSFNDTTIQLLPNLNCGACGYKSCNDFAIAVDNAETEIKKCIHVKQNVPDFGSKNCLSCIGSENLGEKLEWKDRLKRDFDFILDVFEGEPGPKETILPYNPSLVKELGVKKGDVMIGRPMGMSCGCPVTHCGVVSDVDPRNGVIYWNVTGPLRPRTEGFVDIGYYVSQAYEGIIKESKEEIKIGRRYWFLPRRCMLQWRHSGLINAVCKLKDGSYKVRIEGLLIG